jgi:hypothetical protein
MDDDGGVDPRKARAAEQKPPKPVRIKLFRSLANRIPEEST